MLTRRCGIYYYRKAIPQLLHQLIGKREFVISLKTRNSTEALQRALQIDISCNKIISAARSGEINLSDIDSFKINVTKFETETKTVEQPDGTKTTVRKHKIDPDVIAAMHSAGVSPDQIALIVGQFMESMGHPLSADAESLSNRQQMRKNVTLSDYIKRYILEWERMEGRELDSRKKTQLRRLQEALPTDKTICNVSRDDAVTVRDTLAKLPKSTTKYAGMPIQKIIEIVNSESPDYERITHTTIERYFETYKALFSQASEDSIFDGKNPFRDIEIIVGGKRAERQERRRKKAVSKASFTNDDLTKIFSTDLYVNHGNTTEHENVKFWLPLIGLFTGSRMSQIASLYCKDVTVKQGIPVIDFNEAEPDKSGKTDESFRLVPIHPLLMRLGLVEFANKVASYGHKRLFPELRSYNNGTYAGRIDEWFNRNYLVSLNVRSTGDNKSFHAFRSTLLRLLKNVNIEEHTRNKIIGWAKNEERANNVVREHYDEIILQDMLDSLNSLKLPPVFDRIPPFPVNKDMTFERRYLNQHMKK